MLNLRARRRDREAAERLYDRAVAAARRPALYVDFGVPDTLQGRFEMIALHLFALMHRLMHEPGDDPDLARLIAERFVADMDASFREMGVGDVSVPKRMSALYRSFGGRVSAYKAGIEGGRGELVAALARNVFPDDPQDWRAAALGDHLWATVGAVRNADLARLSLGEVQFPEVGAAREDTPS